MVRTFLVLGVSGERRNIGERSSGILRHVHGTNRWRARVSDCELVVEIGTSARKKRRVEWTRRV